jgi:hypothetical protein
MKNLTEYIGSQFGNPRGIIGKICCICMNIINKKLYIKVSDTVKENGIFVNAVYSQEWLKRVS